MGWVCMVGIWEEGRDSDPTGPLSSTHVMSRDSRIGCPGTFLFFELESFGHAAFFVAWLGSWFEAAGLADSVELGDRAFRLPG